MATTTPTLNREEWEKAVCALFTNVQLYGKLHPQVEGIKQILQNGQTHEEEENWYYNPSVTALYEMYPEGVIARVFFTEEKHAEAKFLESRSVEEHLRSVEEHLRSVKRHQCSMEERQRSVEEHQQSVEKYQHSVKEHQRSVEKYQRSVEKYQHPVHSIGLNYSPCTIPGHNCAMEIVKKYKGTNDKPEIHFSQVYINKRKQKDEKEGIRLLIQNGFILNVLDTEPIFQYLLKQAPDDELRRQLKRAYESTVGPRFKRDEDTREFLAKPCFSELSRPTATTVNDDVGPLEDKVASLDIRDQLENGAYETTRKKNESAEKQKQTGREKIDKKVVKGKTAKKN